MSVCSKLLGLLDRLIGNLEVEEVESSGIGLWERVKQFFWPGFESESLLPARDGAKRLRDDWSFLKTCAELMLGWKGEDGDLIMATNSGGKSIVSRIEDVGAEIVEILGKYTVPKKLHRSVSCDDLLKELRDCQRKTDEDLRPEIEEALQHSSEPKIPLDQPRTDFLLEFLGSVTRNLGRIQWRIQDSKEEDCLKQQVSNLRYELECIEKYCHGQVVNENTTNVTLNYYRAFAMIAHRSIAFWFNRRRTDPETGRILLTGIASLHREIDPSIPEVIKSNFNLELAGEELHRLYCFRTWGDEEGLKLQLMSILNLLFSPIMNDYLDNFCSYLLTWGDEEDLKLQLMSLLNLFFRETLKDKDSTAAMKDAKQSSLEELYAVLAEAAFLHRPVLGYRDKLYQDEILLRRSELFVKIRLLKAEIYLKEQLSVSDSSVLSRESPLANSGANVFLENLRAMFHDPCWKHKTEYMEQSLVLNQELTDEFQSLRVRKVADSSVKRSLFQWLFKIVFFKAESFLAVLSKVSDPSMAHSKDQINFLVHKLKYFKLVLTTKPVTNSPDEETVLALIEAFVRRITLLSYSFLPTNDILKKVVISLRQLLDNVDVIAAKFQDINAHLLKSDFPKTYQLGFIDSLSITIKELLKHDHESIAPLKPHIEVVQQYLVSWKSFLSKFSHLDVEQGERNDLRNRIMNVAYKLEYVFESIEIESRLQHSILLCDLLEDIRLVNQEISSIHELSYEWKLQNLRQVAGERIRWKNTPTINEIEVDLVDEQSIIIGRLIRGLSHRDVVSIVGMPGSGKTTLAKKVYNDRKVMYHFHRRAWCTVSQVYSMRNLLLEILSYFHGLTDEIHGMTDDYLQSSVHHCLLKNKYLIVMDDVREIAAWSDLQNIFPEDRNGSRILITSRLWDVALKINPDPHPIRLLSEKESWMLLEKKIFKGNACPQELLHIGKEIAHHCQGLPLAIVAIAGILQQTQKTRDLWEGISESLSSYIIGDPENQCKKVLELSYKHLPECLKPCFLYLGVFLENTDIPVSKLIQFWTAEGFIQEAESKSLEDAAEDCLMNLINGSLVTISKRRSNGKVKACRLHDLVRDLCHSKAKEENFLHLIAWYEEPYASFPDLDYCMEFDDGKESAPLTFESYRLSIYLKRSHFFDSRPSGRKTRSLIFFGANDSEPRCPYDISFIFQNFKLLRVLDLECINMGVSFPVEIGLMLQLRYLGVSGYLHSIPPLISNLWKLETLVVRGLRGKVILPQTIWNMARLRHLHVNNLVAFDLQAHDGQPVGSSIHLDNLVSFSSPVLSCGKDMEEIIRRLPNLRKLRCVWYSAKNCNGLPNLEFLTHLDSLKIIYRGVALDSGRFVLPLILNKLTLSSFRLPWDHISSIGSLPNLRVLKLLDGAFEGARWEMKGEEFKQLKFLELNTLNIVDWDASSDHLPNLERLVLRNCKDLEAIPSDFAYIPMLQTIEVQWCGQSVEESTKVIGDVTEEIKILITHS